MYKKTLAIVMMSALPLLANAADITISNKTDSYGTGYINTLFKTCSSSLGDKGIIKPHQENFRIPESVIKTFCANKVCEAHIFNSQNCNGDKIAIVTLSAADGVISVNNLNRENFIFNVNANDIVIEPANQNRFAKWLKSFF